MPFSFEKISSIFGMGHTNFYVTLFKPYDQNMNTECLVLQRKLVIDRYCITKKTPQIVALSKVKQSAP